MVDLRKRGFANRIIGVDTNVNHQNIALLCGLVDENDTLENAIDKSDLIILSTPVNSNCTMLPGILDRIAGTSKVVTDMGSTKASIAKLQKIILEGEDMLRSIQWQVLNTQALLLLSGNFSTIKLQLFAIRNSVIMMPLITVEKMLDILNMHKVYMNSSDHDVHVAYISHISHITSFSLALSVLEKEQEEQNILTLAGGGFESTVRLAKSNGETWAPIFLENAEYILEVMDTYIEKMNSFRRLISEKDINGLKALMEEANKIRKILN